MAKVTKDQLEKYKKDLANPKTPKAKKNILQRLIKDAENELAKIGTDVEKEVEKVLPKKKKGAMSKKELDKAKADLKKKLGKTEEECEKIIEQYKDLRKSAQERRAKETETKKKSEKRISDLKKSGEIIQGTSEKTAQSTLQTTAEKVSKKVEKDVEKIKKDATSQAKSDLKGKKLSATEKSKRVNEIVEDKVRSKSKKIAETLGFDTGDIVNALTKTLAKYDKVVAKIFLAKLKNDIAKLEAKLSKGESFAFGGLTDGAVANMNITQSQMSAESVNPQLYAKGGRTQGYNDRMDESLGMRHRGRHSQSLKDRRDEAKGMNKAMGRRAYASVGTMDKGHRTLAKGGGVDEETLVVDVVWKQLDEKGLGKFNLKESDVERLEDNYGSTYYFEIYNDTNEKPISYTKMKNILDKSMKDMGLMESYYAKGGNIGESVENQILELLREDTGKHFLDSGGDKGRMWQINQDKIFQNEPRVSYDIYNGEITHSVSLFHYLTDILDEDYFSFEVNEFIQKLAEENSDYHYINSMEDEIQEAFPFIEYKGETINTYNGEQNISQTILFRPFVNTETDEVYVLLQIHGGADVRGGYTLTRCFKLEGYLTGFVDVYGTIDGVEVENTYNGYSLTTEDGEELEVKDDADVSLDFIPMEDTYMYLDYAKGGQLFDDLDIKKGAFTKKAKARGLSTEVFMKKVLANPNRYDEKTRKQAQLMKNMQ